MAYVPEKDVKQLWQEMGENKSWESLRDALQKHPDIGQELDKNMQSKLMMVADRMKNYRFPDSAENLSELLRQRLGTWDDKSHPTF